MILHAFFLKIISETLYTLYTENFTTKLYFKKKKKKKKKKNQLTMTNQSKKFSFI